MNALKKPLAAIALSLLPVILFSFGLLFSLQQVFNSPKPVETALDKSGIYDTFVKDVLAQAKQQDTSASTIPINQPQIQSVIQNAFSPDYLKQQTTTALNATYAWLQGKDAQLNFQLDVSKARSTLIDDLASAADEHLKSLPVCSAASQVDATTDPFSATCVPPNFNRTEAVQKVRDTITNSNQFLSNPTFNAQNVKTSNGKPLDQQLNAIPHAYHWMIISLYLLGALVVLCILAGIFFSSELPVGLRRTGLIMVIVGAITMLVSWLTGLLSQKLVDAAAKSSGNYQPLQEKLASILRELVGDVHHFWFAYGVIVAALGATAMIVAAFLHKSSEASLLAEARTEHPPLPETPSESAPADEPVPHHPKRPSSDTSDEPPTPPER